MQNLLMSLDQCGLHESVGLILLLLIQYGQHGADGPILLLLTHSQLHVLQTHHGIMVSLFRLSLQGMA